MKRRLSARIALRLAVATLIGLTGGAVAVVTAGDVEHEVGPLEATFSVSAALEGDTRVQLAPLGSLTMPTHAGPARLDVRVDQLILPQTQALLDEPDAAARLQSNVENDTRDALRELVAKALLIAAAGGALAAGVAMRRWRAAIVGALAPVVAIAGSLGIAALTFRGDAIAEPRYSGLLTLAPQAIGDVRTVTTRFTAYRAQLESLVNNLSTLYRTVETTPVQAPNESSVRVLHVSDLHLNPAGYDLIERMIEQFGITAVVDTGDINDWGTSFEGNFAQRISTLGVPYIYVRGNHDSLTTQASVAAQPNARVLDNSTTEVEGIRFWGIGDPRFTADKSASSEDGEDERRQAQLFAPVVRNLLGSRTPPPVDVALVHDPATAGALGGRVPLVLAGHSHFRQQRPLADDTTLLVEGSTGAAGLRGTEGESPVPFECSVLYFDRNTKALTAYDSVSVAGLGESGASIRRTVVKPPATAPPPAPISSPTSSPID